MSSRIARTILSLTVLGLVGTLVISAQSFRVQCPTSTITHPSTLNNNNAEPNYNGPTTFSTVPISGTTGGYLVPSANVNGAIKCQQVSGGDGYSTMADGTQTFMFSFGPLSGLADIAAGHPGTEFPAVFNTQAPATLLPGDPATTNGVVANDWLTWTGNAPIVPTTGFAWNGAVGLAPDVPVLVTIYDIQQSTAANDHTVYVQLNSPLGLPNGSQVVIAGTGGTPAQGGYDGKWTVTTNYVFPATVAPQAVNPATGVTNYGFPATYNFTFTIPTALALADVNESQTASVSSGSLMDGHVDPRQIMDVGVMNGNIPAPLVAFDEDDELFLTLTNVGMIMRPDLFE